MANQDVEGGGLKDQNNYQQYASAPYHHENTERQRTSWLIPMFVVANIAIFVITMSVNDCPKKSKPLIEGNCVATFLGRFSFQPLRENPLLGPSSLTLSKLGALERSKVVDDNQKWRLITCIWLHAGVIHIILNTLNLVFIGIRLEQQFGFVRIGIIYLLSGFGGSILSALLINNRISAGASGALLGFVGAMLAELITNWTIYSNKAATLFTLVFIIAINLVIGILPRVDNFAHIGGFSTGLLLGFILLMRPQFRWIQRNNLPPEDRANYKYLVYQYILFLVALFLLVAGFIISLVILFRGQSEYKHCRWCHYLSCVPTSRWDCDL